MRSDCFKEPPDYGKFTPVHYLYIYRNSSFAKSIGVVALKYMMWDSFLTFVEAFNQKWRELVHIMYILIDEPTLPMEDCQT